MALMEHFNTLCKILKSLLYFIILPALLFLHLYLHYDFVHSFNFFLISQFSETYG